MGWCSLWRGSWGFRSSARSTTGSATPTSRTVAPLRLRPETSSRRPADPKPRSDQEPAPAPCPLFSPSVWGRFFGQTIDNHYQAFADPRASGNLGGFQGGIDLLRGSLIAGHYERTGLYGAYGDVNADVNGLVTNPAATAYVLTHTGSINLNAWSAGGYWTHVGPGGWYLDTRAARDQVLAARPAPSSRGSTPTARALSRPWRAAIHSLGRNSGRAS